MRKLLIFIITFIAISSTVITSQTAYASGCAKGFSAAKCSACQGVAELGSSQDCSSNGSTVTKIIKVAIDILSYIIGIVAIIMIIVSGLRFVLSGGNSNNVEAAKKTLIYALVGLVLAALAQVIVHWVLNTSAKTTGSIYSSTQLTVINKTLS